MYTNIRGIKGKISGLTALLDEYSPHLFLVTETQLRSDTGITIPNYTFHSRKREGQVGGGVGILVRNDMRSYVAVHKPDRNIEILWLSIRRKNNPPLILGTYYGKQETTSKEDIEKEMTQLQEEIIEMLKEGEVVLTMDGNAKIGILGEEISRNGDLLLKAFLNTNLEIMNLTNKCNGKITRKNTKKDTEVSAIDFVAASNNAKEWITEVTIDELGLLKIKGKNETDHNTIHFKIDIPELDHISLPKRTGWNINASDEKWELFSSELISKQSDVAECIADKTKPLNQRYKRVVGIIDKAARKTIGKTTFKNGKKTRLSRIVKEMQKKKRIIKKQIQEEKKSPKKDALIKDFKKLRDDITDQITKEKTQSITNKFAKMIADKSRKRSIFSHL